MGMFHSQLSKNNTEKAVISLEAAMKEISTDSLVHPIIV